MSLCYSENTFYHSFCALLLTIFPVSLSLRTHQLLLFWKDGATALLLSAHNGHTDTAKALLAAGAALEHEGKVCACRGGLG